MTKIRVKDVAPLVNDGLTDDEIAARLGVDPSNVTRRRQAAGLEPNRVRDRIRSAVVRLVDGGLTNREIAANLGISEAAVTRHRRAVGLSGQTQASLSPETLARIEQLLADGWSLLEISRTEHLDYSTLIKRFKGRGWTRQQIVEQSTILRHWHANYGTYNYAATYDDIKEAERRIA